VRILKADGRDAVRFEDGVAEWAADGGHIAGASS
jgi:3-mercaptopyruvate sulfurtransferase SseA